MIIPKKVLAKWKMLKSAGDIGDMAEQLRISESTVSRAMNGKPCTTQTFTGISNFYKCREESIKAAS